MVFVPSSLILVCLAETVAVIEEPHAGQQREEQSQQREADRNDNRLEQSVSCAFLYHVVENIKVGNQSRQQINQHPPSPILSRVALHSASLYFSTDDKGDKPHHREM